jgi:hypothetical protein
MACLSYQPSKIVWKGKEYGRHELLQFRVDQLDTLSQPKNSKNGNIKEKEELNKDLAFGKIEVKRKYRSPQPESLGKIVKK